ncbi:hypothetical protein HKCCE3408_14620, partial [Rhodobacterales bacterium HKCCE3408]|nr:hypothetical protein [Rhodobacterales bacterium HKCCE3408]
RPGATAAGARTVIAIPDRDPAAPPPPVRPDLVAALTDHLGPTRLLGERLFVSTPVYVPVDVEVTLAILPDADPDTVTESAKALIRARLSDIAHPGRDTDPWPPGRPIGPGDIRALMARLPDVTRVIACDIRTADGREPRDGILSLGDRGIAIARRVTILTEEAAP